MHQPTLLLITQDPQLRYLLTLYGERSGYEVRCVNTVEQLVLPGHQRPDIVLLHLLGPDHGWERVRRLKAHPAVGGIPVVIISAVAEPAQPHAEGVAHWLQRPVMYADFLTALQATVAQAQPG